MHRLRVPMQPWTPLYPTCMQQYNGTILATERLFMSVDHASISTPASVMSKSELLALPLLHCNLVLTSSFDLLVFLLPLGEWMDFD